MSNLEKTLLCYCEELLENTVLEDDLHTMGEIMFSNSITIDCMEEIEG